MLLGEHFTFISWGFDQCQPDTNQNMSAHLSATAMKAQLDILGFHKKQAVWMRDFVRLAEFEHWSFLNNWTLKEIAKTVSNLSVNPFVMNPTVVANCTVFMFWVQFQYEFGIKFKDLKLAHFTQEQKEELINFYCAGREFFTNDVDTPKPFTLIKGYQNQFEALNNKPSDTKPETMSTQDYFYWLGLLSSTTFEKDSKQPLTIIYLSLCNISVYNTIKKYLQSKDGYQAFLMLHKQFKGCDTIPNNYTKALGELKDLPHTN